MNTMKTLVLAAALATPLVAQAQAQERLVDAARIFAMLDKFYAAPPAERSELALRYTLSRDGKPAGDLRLWLVVNGKRTVIPVAPDGRVERLPTPAELAAHAQVAIAAPPAAKFSSRLDIDTSIRPAQEISAAQCDLAVNQANAAIRRAAGLMAMMAPKVKAVTFPGAGSGVAVMGDGKTLPLPLTKGVPAYDPDAIKDAKIIRLAKTPALVSLE